MARRLSIVAFYALLLFSAARVLDACPLQTACVMDGRFEIRVEAREPRTGAVAAATPLFERDGVAFFSVPDLTGDPFNAEVAVKIVDARGAGGGFLVFHAPLTDLEYVATIRDASTGQTMTLTKPSGSLCGETQSLPATGIAGGAKLRSQDHAASSCTPEANALCLFGGRFRVTATAGSASVFPAAAIPYNDSFGTFSLPAATGAPERAEVAVKLVDAMPLDGSVWILYGALTDLPFTLNVTDTATGSTRTYHGAGGRPCGGIAFGAFPSVPCEAAGIVSVPGATAVPRGQATTLEVIASGTPPLRYQWSRKSTDGTFVDIPGAIGPLLATGPLTSAATFAVRVANSCGAAERSIEVSLKEAKATLTVRKRGTGQGLVTANIPGLQCDDAAETCSATVDAGTRVRLTATPSAGSTFAGWSGACLGADRCLLTLDDNRTVNAFFEAARAIVPVPASGGTVTLEGVGDVTFPAGALPAGHVVSAIATHSAETKEDFDTTAVLFSPTARSGYEVRVNTGLVAPSAPVGFVLKIPPPLVAASATNEIKLFAQIFENGGEEVLDSFEMFPSTVSGTTLSGTLPPEAFTNMRTADGSYEAIVVLAATPTKPDAAARQKRQSPTSGLGREEARPRPADAIASSFRGDGRIEGAASGSACQGASLGDPIGGGVTVTGKFHPPGHYGTDLRAPKGTPVQAMADGKVKIIDFQVKTLPRTDPRSGSRTKGWGRYVVVEHTDGSTTLYAHLENDGVIVSVGQKVSKGDVLATSDTTGGASAPHLHVEYAPDGKTFNNPSKVDPEPCIGSNVGGSISIRDNGPLADDAFTLFINSTEICSTAIGASNTCSVNNLRPGTVTLTVKCTVAPDNVGTYEVTLSDGLTFAGGGTSRSGTLPQGDTTSFAVTVPP